MIEKVLLVFKKSELEILQEHIDDVRTSWQIKNGLDLLYEGKQEHTMVLNHVEEILKTNNISYDKVWRGNLKHSSLQGYDAEIVVGGDGTLLEAVRYCGHVPLLHVNSDKRFDNAGKRIGSRGYYSGADKDNLDEQMDKFMSGELSVTKMDRLCVQLKDLVGCNPIIEEQVLNDIYINNSSNRIVQFSVNCPECNVTETAEGKGYIIATPQSCWSIQNHHAEILPFGKGYFQTVIDDPVSDTLNCDGFILAKPSSLIIESSSVRAHISCDGSHRRYDFGSGYKLTVSVSDNPVSILAFDNDRRLREFAVPRKPSIMDLR